MASHLDSLGWRAFAPALLGRAAGGEVTLGLGCRASPWGWCAGGGAGAGRGDGQSEGGLLRVTLFVLLDLDDLGLDHFVVEIVAFTRALTDAREHRDAAMQLGDIVDQFHDDDGLADAGAADRPDLSALHERPDEDNDPGPLAPPRPRCRAGLYVALLPPGFAGPRQVGRVLCHVAGG